MITIFPLFFLVAFTVCEDNVRFAAVLYRHGDRTPVTTYPTDPWRNQSNWPVKFGELTNEGKRQHFELGQWLRKRYGSMLSANFDPAEIYVRSTDVDRTLMSAQVNLAGMYPPQGQGVWSPDLKWQPVPVHTVPEKDDQILAMKKKCPNYDKEYERVIETNEYQSKLSRYNKLMNYLTAKTQLPIEDYDDINDLYNTLYIESLYNFSLPNWTETVYPDKMREPACYSFIVPTMNPMLARLKSAPFLQQVLKSMTHIISNESLETNYTQQRLAIYSAHDITVANVLNSLGIFDGDCPCYTATVFMELIKDNGTYHIRISYRNSTMNIEPHVLTIPHCGKICPIERFQRLYRDLITVNWNFECGNRSFPEQFGVSFFVCLTLLFMVYLVKKIHLNIMSNNGTASGYSHVTYTVGSSATTFVKSGRI